MKPDKEGLGLNCDITSIALSNKQFLAHVHMFICYVMLCYISNCLGAVSIEGFIWSLLREKRTECILEQHAAAQ